MNEKLLLLFLLTWSVSHAQFKPKFEPDYKSYSYIDSRIRISIKTTAPPQDIVSKYNYVVNQINSKGSQRCNHEIKSTGNDAFDLFLTPCDTSKTSQYFVFSLKVSDKQTKKSVGSSLKITISRKVLFPEGTDIANSFLSQNDEILNPDNVAIPNNISDEGNGTVKTRVDINGSCIYLTVILNQIRDSDEGDWEISQLLSSTSSQTRKITIQHLSFDAKKRVVVLQIIPIKSAILQFNIVNTKTHKKYSLDATQYKSQDFNSLCSDAEIVYSNEAKKNDKFWQKYPIKTYIISGICIGIVASLILYFLLMRSRGSRKITPKPEPVESESASGGIVFEESGTITPFPISIGIVPEGYRELSNLKKVYEDTCISKIYIGEQAARDIFELVLESLRTNPAPEVGGFLMGKVELESPDTGLYHLFIDKFIRDTEPSYQDTYTITFGSEISLRELEYLNKFPFAKKIGWLHTHPGHGIFSYKLSSKEVNNSKERKETEFITWKDFI